MNLGKPPPVRHRESLPALGSVRLPPPRFEIWAWQQQARCGGLPAHVFFPEGLRGLTSTGSKIGPSGSVLSAPW